MAACCRTLGLSLLLLSLATGCGLLRTASKVPGEAVKAVTPGKKDAKAINPVEVQDTLLRFTDAFMTQSEPRH